MLAQSPEGFSSDCMAGSVNTHAAYVRRVLSELVHAGLVRASEGRCGGYRLARAAERISLAEIYRVMEPQGPLTPSPAEPNQECPVGCSMRAAFDEVMTAAQFGLLAALERRTVADVSDRALTLGKER